MDLPIEIHEQIVNYLSGRTLRAYAATGKTCRALVKRCKVVTLSVEVFSGFLLTVATKDSKTLTRNVVLTSIIGNDMMFMFPDGCFSRHFSRPNSDKLDLWFRFPWKNETWTAVPTEYFPDNSTNIVMDLTRSKKFTWVEDFVSETYLGYNELEERKHMEMLVWWDTYDHV